MTKKITKMEKLEMLATIIEDSALNQTEKDMLFDFVGNEIRLLDEKSKKSSGGSKVNDNIANIVLQVLAEQETAITIATMLEDDRLQTYIDGEGDKQKVVKMSGQKLSAIVSKLKKEGKVIRTEVKKRAYFSLPQE